jgi:hypothetical protein
VSKMRALLHPSSPNSEREHEQWSVSIDKRTSAAGVYLWLLAADERWIPRAGSERVRHCEGDRNGSGGWLRRDSGPARGVSQTALGMNKRWITAGGRRGRAKDAGRRGRRVDASSERMSGERQAIGGDGAGTRGAPSACSDPYRRSQACARDGERAACAGRRAAAGAAGVCRGGR